jgi:predicted outer membrane repeat protein
MVDNRTKNSYAGIHAETGELVTHQTQPVPHGSTRISFLEDIAEESGGAVAG